MIRRLTLGLILLATGLGACGGDDSRASSACLSAFRNAQPRAGAPYETGPLDDAIRRCRTVDEWIDAWKTVPDAHPSSREALPYLEQRCQAGELDITALCRDLGTKAG